MNPYELRALAKRLAAVSGVLLALAYVVEEARDAARNAAEWQVQLHEMDHHDDPEDDEGSA